MLDPTQKKKLRDALSGVLTNPQEIRIICGDARLPVQQLNMTGSPELLWEEALEKTNRGGDDTLRRLLEEASKKAPVLQTDPTFMAFFGGNHDQHTATGPIAAPVPASTTERRRRLSIDYREALQRLKQAQRFDATEAMLHALKERALKLRNLLLEEPIRPEDVIDQRYRIYRSLGRGGFATAWLAEDLERGTFVVLKVLHPELLEQEDRLLRFARGCTQLERLTHPHILNVLVPHQQSTDREAGGQSQDRHFVVLEWAELGDLTQWMRSQKPGLEACLDRILEAAEGLQYAHEQDCIHRDIKPQNLLVTRAGQVKLTDFDLAKLLDSTLLTRSHMVAGTAYYTAPEVSDEPEVGQVQEVGPHTDVYSLGMTLLYLLCKKHANARVIRRLPQVIGELAVGDALKQVIEKAVEVEPEDRYPSMAAFRKALAEAREAEVARLLEGEQPPMVPQEGTVNLAMAAEVPQQRSTHSPAAPRQAEVQARAEPSSAPARPSTVASPQSSAKTVPAWWNAPDFARLPAQQRIERLLELGRTGDPRLGMEKEERWVYISPGSFVMGDDESSQADQRPAHRVTLTRGFHIGRFPVTNAEYGLFVKDGGYSDQRWWSTQGWVERTDDAWTQPGQWDDGRWNANNQPVVEVSWYEADAFCAWLTHSLRKKHSSWPNEGTVVRLPTEAEWAWAARGESSRPFPWGGDKPTHELANSARIVGQTSPVGAYPAGNSPEGVSDLAGNVWEWCSDWHSGSYYKDSPSEDPVGPENGLVRVIRGGSWDDNASWLQSSYRSGGRPGYRDSFLGFRVVVSGPTART